MGKMNRTLGTVMLAAMLASCGGGDEQSTPGGLTVSKAECPNQFVAAGSQVTRQCINCQSSGAGDSLKANDGNRSSFATLTSSTTDTGSSAVPVSSTPASVLAIRVDAPSGVSFPAGTRAGAIVQLAAGEATTQQAVTVTTYLGSEAQEIFNGGSQTSGAQSAQDKVFAYPTTKAYDAVQFSVEINRPAPAPERPQIRVYEFCG
jgi:hypothetical protein